jgi:hypothetical protein
MSMAQQKLNRCPQMQTHKCIYACEEVPVRSVEGVEENVVVDCGEEVGLTEWRSLPSGSRRPRRIKQTSRMLFTGAFYSPNKYSFTGIIVPVSLYLSVFTCGEEGLYS